MKGTMGSRSGARNLGGNRKVRLARILARVKAKRKAVKG